MMKLGDKLVLIGGLLFVVWLYAAFWFSPAGLSNFAQVTVAGKEQRLVNLKEDGIVEMEGQLGISKLEIADGRIRFLESPCPNKICIHAGWLEEGSKIATCLPNRIAVEVVANKTLFDSINF